MANHFDDPVSIVEDAAEERVRFCSDGWEVRGGLLTRHGVSLQSRAAAPRSRAQIETLARCFSMGQTIETMRQCGEIQVFQILVIRTVHVNA